jgi:hypothetical protein
MSIVRVGMAEDKKFGDGYEAIFGSKPAKKAGKAAKKPAAKAAKKGGAKKSAKKR